MSNVAELKNNLKEKAVTKPKTPASLMTAALNGESMKKLLSETVRDNRDSFVASLIDLYSSDDALAQCAPGAVIKEALKAVSLKLPINKQMGFAYIIPYKNKPTFQIGYKGYIQLCMRSGVYKTINTDVVYEGELVSQSKLTGEVDLTGEKISDAVIGYFAYIETVNGFSKCLYWSKDNVIKHAGTHSQSFKKGSDIWTKYFDEMAQKTVLRNLLAKYGLMSVELEKAFTEENSSAANDLIQEDTNDHEDAIETDYTVDTETGEVIDSEVMGHDNESGK